MKKIVKCLILLILILLILLIGKLIYDKINYEKEKEKIKISDNMYFLGNKTELILYNNGTYFIYEDDNINSGEYEINDNNISFKPSKKYSNKCYNLVDNTTF